MIWLLARVTTSIPADTNPATFRGELLNTIDFVGWGVVLRVREHSRLAMVMSAAPPRYGTVGAKMAWTPCVGMIPPGDSYERAIMMSPTKFSRSGKLVGPWSMATRTDACP